MIKPKSDPRWKMLIEGKIKHEFRNISGSLMLNRITRQYSINPTPEQMMFCIDEIIAFFARHESQFEDDLKKIF